MSPSASGSVLPCSAVRHAASFFMSRRISSWSFSMMRARCPIGTFLQVLNAAAAAFTALSTSSAPHIGTRASTSWVAGLTTSRHSFAFESTNCPFTSSFTRGTEGDATWGFAAIGFSYGNTSIIEPVRQPLLPDVPTFRHIQVEEPHGPQHEGHRRYQCATNHADPREVRSEPPVAWLERRGRSRGAPDVHELGRLRDRGGAS